ncbi:MAG: HEPN domain-containing protein [Magnetococcales bacterium]|nr:HEPN domain-containing protein [Magnetococcales bacterium]
MNIGRHIDYWRRGSDEDEETAAILLEKGKLREGLFFMHLSMEKVLKALVTRITAAPPPKIHNLVQLLQRTNIPMDQDGLKLFRLLNGYCMEGRYPSEVAPPPSEERAGEIFRQAQEVRKWLISQC